MAKGGIPAYDIVPIADHTKPLVYERYTSTSNESQYVKPFTLFQISMKLNKPSGALVDLRGSRVAYVLEVVSEEKKRDNK